LLQRLSRISRVVSLSVITPSLNQGRFVERTIQSVLQQKMPGLEYLVQDGGSTDGTIELLKRYEGGLRWVSESDLGQAQAVNRGIQATSGEVIGWLNSDDVYEPGALEIVCEYFESQPDVDVLYGAARQIDPDDRPLGPYYTEEWDLEWLKEQCFICQPAAFFHRRMVQQHGLLDERLRYCLDYEYWLRLALGGARFVYLPQVLAASRLYTDTKTLGAQVDVCRETSEMLRSKLGRVPDRWLYRFARAVVETRRWPRAAVPMVFAKAAWRWNRQPPWVALPTFARWLRGDVRRASHPWPGRSIASPPGRGRSALGGPGEGKR